MTLVDIAPQEQGGCGTLNLVQGAVRSAPGALVLCLAWGAAPPSDADLATVLAVLPARLDARAAFPGRQLSVSLKHIAALGLPVMSGPLDLHCIP